MYKYVIEVTGDFFEECERKEIPFFDRKKVLNKNVAKEIKEKYADDNIGGVINSIEKHFTALMDEQIAFVEQKITRFIGLVNYTLKFFYFEGEYCPVVKISNDSSFIFTNTEYTAHLEEFLKEKSVRHIKLKAIELS
jgi:hypothetical protein